jgi:hypothetical protein
VILFFFTFGETVGFTPTHQMEIVSPTFEMPTGTAAAEDKK